MVDYPSTEEILSDVNSEKEKTESSEVKTEAAPQSPWTEDEFEIEGGKRIKEPREMILKRAGLGYHAAQKLQYANQIMEKYKGYDEKISTLQRWQDYNDYAEKNPEWARHVEESWNSRLNMQQLNQAQQTQSLQLPPEILEKINRFEQITEELTKQKEAIKIEKEDKEFAGEIESVAKQFAVDLSLANEKGESLEVQILNHMREMGLTGDKPGHFRAAFKDYYFDQLLGRQKEQVKESEAKSLEERRKAGILDISRTPKSSKAFNAASHSYNELGEMALADLRAAKAK